MTEQIVFPIVDLYVCLDGLLYPVILKEDRSVDDEELPITTVSNKHVAKVLFVAKDRVVEAPDTMKEKEKDVQRRNSNDIIDACFKA